MPFREAKLLLVDDDATAIRVMSRMLAEFADQRFATSGADALHLARELTPDLILLDADMPGVSGLDVCTALKAEPRLARVPVIFVTRHDSPEIEVAALGRGAADFVSKPLVAEQLCARVRAQLRSIALLEDSRREPGRPGLHSGSTSSSTPRLLIVDDDVAAIRVLRNTLAAAGDFHFATSGHDALACADALQPDLILLDVHMPGNDGFETCAALKAKPAFRHVPIVFVTRFSDTTNETRALEMGAADFIAKPYTSAVLQARVRNLLELKRRNDAELLAIGEHWQRVGDARVVEIVSAASDAIVSHDAEGKLVLINAAACRMFGVDHADMIGQPAHRLLGASLLPLSPDAGSPFRIPLARSDGATFVAEGVVSVLGDGSGRLTTLLLRDISDRERLEAAALARAQAEASSRAKTLMLSYVAHEMGNPLNGLLGFSQLMAADHEHPLPPPQAHRLSQMDICTARLEALMGDLINLGRIETGHLQVNLRPTEVGEVVQAAIVAVESQAAQACVTLHWQPASGPAPVLADAQRLHQCLVNLLSNGIKYNQSGGRVEVSLEAEASRAILVVRDNGVGMDALQLKHLFEPFNRLGRDTGTTPGSGLGLSITQGLVVAMRGQLAVQSEPGKGSCFTISLPRERRAALA